MVEQGAGIMVICLHVPGGGASRRGKGGGGHTGDMSSVLTTTRAACLRPTDSCLQDLTAYKKYKEKAVASAARSLITLFREIAPYMLEKKDRGRGADLEARPMQYGAGQIRVGTLTAFQPAQLSSHICRVCGCEMHGLHVIC